MTRTVVENTSNDGWADMNGMYLSRGTMTVETRPTRFDGAFQPTSLEVAFTQGEVRTLRGDGELIEPLPADQQPAQDDPLDVPETAAPSPAPSATPVADCFMEPCNDVIVQPGGGGEEAGAGRSSRAPTTGCPTSSSSIGPLSAGWSSLTHARSAPT